MAAERQPAKQRVEPASPAAAEAARGEQAAERLPIGAGPRHAPPPAQHPTARGRRQASVLARQSVAGNAAVQRALQRQERQPGVAQAGDPALLTDGTGVAGPGQLSKAELLTRLRPALYQAVAESLPGGLGAEQSRAEVDSAIARYAAQDARTLDATIRREIPEAAGVQSADAYVPLIVARVRRELPGAVAGGPLSAAGQAIGGAVSAVSGLIGGLGRLLFKARPGGAAAADPAAVRSRLGPGRPLEGAARGRMERAFGRNFGAVRLHDDAAAAGLSGELNARAFAVGSDIAFGAGEYRPGTPVGDALLAHELAHVIQQRDSPAPQVQPKGPASGGDQALEYDADRSAVQAVLALWGGAAGRLGQIAERATPALRSGLALQRCIKSCGSEPSLLEQLNGITDVPGLAHRLGELSDEQLNGLPRDLPGDSLVGKGLRWERAFRGHRWDQLAELSRAGAQEFPAGYSERLTTLIMAGRMSIRVDASDPAFAEAIREQLRELLNLASGFRLVADLLATGQVVQIRATTEGHTTERAPRGEELNPGLLNAYDENATPLPPDQQRPGQATGSTVSINPALFGNQVTLGSGPGGPRIIDQQATVTFGHELIHALHNARGENISPTMGAKLRGVVSGGDAGILVTNPATGRPEPAEELRTITGATSFSAPAGLTGAPGVPLSYNVTAGDVSENDLRGDLGLDARASHQGATRAHRVPARANETLEQLLGRYRMASGGAVPAPLMAHVRNVFLEFNPYFRDSPAVPAAAEGMYLDFPHETYMALYLGSIIRNDALAEQALQLRVSTR